MVDEDSVIGITPAVTARRDIMTAQIADTAVRVGEYFKALTACGISAEAATDMTVLFNEMLLHHHFGVEYKMNNGNPFSFLEMD